MSYDASGDGTIRFKKVGPEIITEATSILQEQFETTCRIESDQVVFNVIHPYEKYHEDGVIYALHLVSGLDGFITGEIEFSGEDDSHWRFLHNGEKWIEENGSIVYGFCQKDIVRLLALFVGYVSNDLESADHDYVREVLFDKLGISEKEAKKYGISALLPETEDGDTT